MQNEHFAIIYWLSLLAVLFAYQFAAGQPGVQEFKTIDFFGSTASTYNASMDSTGYSGIWGMRSTSSADTIESQVFTSLALRAGQTVYIHARRDSLGGTPDTCLLEIGLWRGESYNSSAGYEWKKVYEWGLLEGDAGVSLVDSTWFTKNVASKFKFRIIETQADSNFYFLDFFIQRTAR